MYDLVVTFKKELEKEANTLAISNGSIAHDHGTYLLNVGKVQGLQLALSMYSDYLRKLNKDED